MKRQDYYSQHDTKVKSDLKQKKSFTVYNRTSNKIDKVEEHHHPIQKEELGYYYSNVMRNTAAPITVLEQKENTTE